MGSQFQAVQQGETLKPEIMEMPYWYRRVFLLAIPLILSNLTQPLLSMVDTIFSGHLPGPAALGGVAVGGIFFNSIYWTFGFVRMATTGLVAQSHGAADQDQVMHHFGRALLTAMLLGGLLLAIQRPLIAWHWRCSAPAPRCKERASLLQHSHMAAPAALANYTILGYMLGKQHARTALLLQATINVVNVVVALTLVLWWHWGVAGIATATMTAEWIGCFLGLGLMLASGARPGHVRWSELIDAKSLRRLFALNRDILLRTLSLVAAYVWLTRTGARSGNAILAANAVLINFLWIAGYGLDGFANATEALVGEAIGAQRLADYRAVLKASSVSAFTVAAGLSLLYLLFGKGIIAIFTNQEAIRLLAGQYLPWLIVLPLVAVWSFLLDGVFIGATRAAELRDSMLIALLGYLGLAILLRARFGNHGLWCAMLAFMALRAVTLALRLPAIERKSFAIKQAPVEA